MLLLLILSSKRHTRCYLKVGCSLICESVLNSPVQNKRIGRKMYISMHHLSSGGEYLTLHEGKCYQPDFHEKTMSLCKLHNTNEQTQTCLCFSFSDQSVKLVPFHLYFHAYPGRQLLNAMVRLHSYPQTTKHCIRLSNPNPVLVPARPPQQIRRIHITFPTLGLRNNIVRF